MTASIAKTMGEASPLVLQAGDAVCEIWPERGGSIGRWSIGDQDMMRRTNIANLPTHDPLSMASFPLVPFSNRIGFGQFNWAGKAHDIVPNFPPEPHAIHGTGWTSRWDGHQENSGEAMLSLHHDADARWPWSFVARQHITLSETTLTIAMSATNLTDMLVPLAFGHHPYFDAAGASLQFHADTFWSTGPDGIPATTQAPEGDCAFSELSPVEGRALDNGYAGWDGVAQIVWQDRPLSLRVRANMAAAVLFIPKDGDFFCFEPVPHIINALNLPGHSPQMPLVAPQASYKTAITFEATPGGGAS
jgi:aldose 1-epimerase